jgi:DNA-binding transcriptional LysR family regulator
MLSFYLSSLIVFSEVVKLKSFSKAAETLSMAQPGVSKHIALLESHAGKLLVLRKKHA